MRRARPTISTPAPEVPADVLGLSTAPVEPTDGVWSTMSLAGVAVAVLAPDTTVVWANPSLCDLLETPAIDMIGQPMGRLLGAEPGDRVAGAIASTTRLGTPTQRLTLPLHRRDGSLRSITLSAARTEAWTEPGHSVVIVEGPAQPRTAGTQASDRRTHTGDALTGLPGRATFESLLVSALRDAATTRRPFALLIGDLDGFRVLNETYGPAIGDQVLQWVAERLSATLHHHDTMGRLGGDEFVFIAERVPDEQTARAVGRRLADAIHEPIAGSDVAPLSMCIGITLATGRERPVDLLAEADRALQAARANGPGSIATLGDLAGAVTTTNPEEPLPAVAE